MSNIKKTTKCESIYNLGIDIGSTTVKIICLDPKGEICFSSYQRHLVGIYTSLQQILSKAYESLGDIEVSIVVTGSVGMGVAELYSATFLQEVVAASEVIKQKHKEVKGLIDIGGEDAKLIVFKEGKSPLMRMNGNCAGGTGAFIDQMAIILDISVDEMNKLAFQSTQRHSISSRCGVFAKTDIQNLISRNVNKADICASIFYALAHQTVTTLIKGLDLKGKTLFCGGPLSFIPYLRFAFKEVLKLKEEDIILPDYSVNIPAYGCALIKERGSETNKLKDIIEQIKNDKHENVSSLDESLPKLFESEADFNLWKEKKQNHIVDRIEIKDSSDKLYLGIDSGSTTTKIVLIDKNDCLVFSHYQKNNGDPLKAVSKGLSLCEDKAKELNKKIIISSSCVTGYGEDLIKKAFGINYGIVETIAHYQGALKYNPEVSFILDIGGQDMKAIFVDQGIIKRIEINEACSSGCGSFIDSFANSMNYSVEKFASMACEAQKPCDLGTRCTVFMNSKVKQFLRTNAAPHDIAAGLSYSVIKNMLHKVLKIKNIEELGNHISVQGGTFKNLSVVKALENITKTEVVFTDVPELMGALGCALFAKNKSLKNTLNQDITLSELCKEREFTTKQSQCKACENQCHIQIYNFGDNKKYFTGNKCEKYFSNQGTQITAGENNSEWKDKIIFDREIMNYENSLTIGIPRALNMYENYPFWHALFTSCGINIKVSDPSTFKQYENNTNTIMSDNICFPAKLVHGHVTNLMERNVDRIFMPYVLFESKDESNTSNSYNCPIVSGYSDVIKSAINPSIPVDSPSISFKDNDLLKKSCSNYIKGIMPKLSTKEVNNAFTEALEAQNNHKKELQAKSQKIFDKAVKENRMMIMLTGRPYHHDPLIQHKISEIICGFGVDVITDDIVRHNDTILAKKQGTVMQWQYTNNIIKATHFVAQSKENIHLVQLSSFGCGPDAFIVDEIQDILERAHKNHTLLKIDDVTNQGSLKLRIRSLIESLKLKNIENEPPPIEAPNNKTFKLEDRKRTILLPFFSEFYSPLIPKIFKIAGFKAENLPPSDKQSQEYGLQYINNEVCFPTTVVVGDIIKVMKSGKYKSDEIAFGMTQTGGQCRASNYLSLIKKSVLQAGFPDVPIVSVAMGEGLVNEQDGFEINWKKIAKKIINGLLFCDSISKLYYASFPRENKTGEADRLKNKYITEATSILESADTKAILALIKKAAKEFSTIIIKDKKVARVGVVGEIFVKYNAQSNFHSIEWMKNQEIELVIPPLLDFATQFFVNRKVNASEFTEKKSSLFENAMVEIIHKYLNKKVEKFNKACSIFPYFMPFTDIFKEADNAKEIVNLSAQFGEGWLIPAEFAYFAHNNINHAVSLQPFGCIANHVISKGIEKRVMELYPDMNLLFLDFDNGLSQVNMHNRLHFMINNAKERLSCKY